MSTWLANLVAIIHAGLILLSFAGALAVLRGRFASARPLPRWQIIYLWAAVGGSLSTVIHGDCVLTTLEKRLRQWSPPAVAYDGSFVSHYLPIVPTWVADRVFLVLAAAAVVGICQTVCFGAGLKGPALLRARGEE